MPPPADQKARAITIPRIILLPGVFVLCCGLALVPGLRALGMAAFFIAFLALISVGWKLDIQRRKRLSQGEKTAVAAALAAIAGLGVGLFLSVALMP